MTDDPASKGRASARSRLVGPLIGSTHRVLRALDLWSDGPGGYDARTIALLEMYAAAAVATIERARLQAEMQERRRFDSDLALARTVMVDLLPKNPAVWAMAQQLLGEGEVVEPENVRGIYCTLPYGDHEGRPDNCHVDAHPFHRQGSTTAG